MSIVIKGLDTWSMFSQRCMNQCLMLMLNIVMTAVSIRILIDWRLGIASIMFAVSIIVLSMRGTRMIKPLRKKLKDLFDEGNRYCALWMMSKHEILQNNKI
jgi:signal transduction histidine kinase